MKNINKSLAFEINGFSTSYLDCCKPSCSWTEIEGAGNEARQPDYCKSNVIADYSARNLSNGDRSLLT